MAADTHMSRPTVIISRDAIDAVVFDMDGVVTQTAAVHAAAWTALFDAYLAVIAQRERGAFVPFTQSDYLRFVDGKPRYDGVHDFLASRGLSLPWGDPSDPPDAETVCGLGNRKDAHFHRLVAEQGVQPYPSTVALIGELKGAGLRVAIISASKNTTKILEAAGVRGLFEAQVDGEVAADLGLPGKPDPAAACSRPRSTARSQPTWASRASPTPPSSSRRRDGSAPRRVAPPSSRTRSPASRPAGAAASPSSSASTAAATARRSPPPAPTPWSTTSPRCGSPTDPVAASSVRR
jgi:beta-phosphoglucomutase-like phosphatase (HAD superfamily)